MHARKHNLYRPACPDHGGKCTANVPMDASIGDEFQWCKESFELFEKDEVPLKISQLTTDLDSRAGEAVKSVYKKDGLAPGNLKCTRHLSQSQRRRAQKVNWSSAMFPARDKNSVNSMIRQFGYNLSRRCTHEYNVCYEKLCGNVKRMNIKFEYVINAIILCYQGDHSLCVRHSYACTGLKKGTWKVSFLPAGVYLTPSVSDLEKLKHLVMYRLGQPAIQATRFKTDTQRVESVNRSYSRTNPKNVTWCRNVTGRLHSAVHMLNLGFGNSTLARLETLGAPITHGSTQVKQLRSVTTQFEYNKKYTGSIKYKQARRERRHTLEWLHRHKKSKGRVSYKRDCDNQKLLNYSVSKKKKRQ